MTKIGPRGARALRWARCLLLLSMLVAPPHAIAQPSAPHDPDSILVRFGTWVSAEAKALAHTLVGAHAFKRFQIVEGLQAVRIPPGITVKEALEFYRQQPDVLYAEPNWIVETQLIPNDPRFGELWGLHNTGQNFGTPDADIDAPEAWDITIGSSDVVVTVIDSGIDYNHQDLSANMFRNTADCNSNGVDDDGNGHIDDCFGIDTANNDSNPFDDNNHGTHVAGTIGAAGNNGVGVVGVNWTVRLMACKFLNAAGSGTTADAIDCLEYVKLMKDRGVNIVATNNSWGGGPFSQALFDAIEAHLKRGILFIAAAGNDGLNNDTTPHFPSSYYLPNVIAVAATTRTNGQSSFSNFGRRTVHLGAPGSEILSTTPGNTYSTFNGTSMATPHVTGVAALVKTQDPSRDWRAIKNLILAGGDAIAALATSTITQKRLNARGALTCSNSTVLSRLLPVSTTISGSIGTPIDLAALHINCANPNGNVSVAVNPGGEVVSLLDDGLGSDQASGDGIYSGRWTPSAGGTFTLTFPGGDVVTVQVLANYSVTSTTFSYRNITGTNLDLGDDTSASIISAFPILFGGGSLTTLFVSSNGNVNFTGSFNTPTNASMPTSPATTLVAPWWDDLFPVVGTSQNVFWEVTGSAPNRELVIEWKDVRHFSCLSDSAATTKFQVVFFEGSSSILFNYADVFFGGACTFADRSGSATVGVQVGPSLGTQFSFNSLSLNNNTALLWTAGAAPATPTLDVTPTSRAFGNVPVGSSEDRTFTVQNIGGSTLTGNATTNVPFTVVSGGFYALTAGQSQRVTVRFTPTSAGTFGGSVSFSGAGGTSRSMTGTGISVSPIAPSGLTATPVSASQINLAWQDNNGNETQTRIERKTGAGGTFAQIATAGADVTSFSDTGLTPSTNFVYRVRACNAVGCSGFSNEAAASTQGGFTLTVTVRGSASGTVTSNPAGINCGTDCSEGYSSGTMVTLSVSHGADVRFKGWSGACTGTSTCTVTMSAARMVTATVSKIFTDGSGNDGIIPSGGSTIKAIHITEMRSAIDRIRAQNGLASFSYTDPTLTQGGTTVKQVHFAELRMALTQAYQQAGQTPPAFTDPTISPRVTLIRASHLNELRAATHVLD